MAYIFECYHCGIGLKAQADQAGDVMKCPDCGGSVNVPHAFIEPGTVIGGFRIQKLIGSGGMADVFVAEQLAMGREVALKVIDPLLARDSETAENFIREMQMTARLEHPNIVTVYDAGESEGYLFLAMSKVQGEDVDQLLRREGALPERKAIRIGLSVANALDYAWSTGEILHRDIKPANIMVDDEGNVKLMDLGIAESVADDHLPKPVEKGETERFVEGTPFYMSPEQALGRSLNFASDVYALGGTMFHVLTGQLPYPGEDPQAIMLSQINAPIPSARELNPRISLECDRMIAKMMAKKPDQRHGSWSELIAEMERLAEHPPAPAMQEGEAAPIKITAVKAKKTKAKEVPKRRPASTPRTSVPNVAAQNGMSFNAAVIWAIGIVLLILIFYAIFASVKSP